MAGAETPLQFRLGAMIIEEEDFAMSMLFIAVAIESFLRRVLRDFVDVSLRHCDGYRSRSGTRILQL